MKITKAEYDAIRNNGADIDISKISSCSSPSIEACETNCPNYHGCQTIAMQMIFWLRMRTGNWKWKDRRNL